MIKNYFGASRWRDVGIVLLLSMPMIFVVVFLIGLSGAGNFKAITQWFDPLFFQYNLLLWSLFVLIIPAITYFYNYSMKEERRERLKSELKDNWIKFEKRIDLAIQRQFGMPNYLGSTLTLMLVVAMGLGVLLLAKPLPSEGLGLDYSQGANFFLMGAFIELSTDDPEYFSRIIYSLSAFQFGFLGAYVYFIQHLVRSYFTLDLTPNTFVAMSVRMVTAGLVALVFSFILLQLPGFSDSTAENNDKFLAFLPMVSFAIGMAPVRAILAIEKILRSVVSWIPAPEKSKSIPLSELSGMSSQHEVRLRREGYDNVENIAEANPVEMAVRTGFSYSQLRTWVGEAWLRTHFGKEDFLMLANETAVRTADQLKLFADDQETILDAVSQDRLKLKILSAIRLLQNWDPNR